MALSINPRIVKLDGQHILYDSSLLEKPFNELFSIDWFAERGLLIGPTGGRGEGFFLRFEEQEWVLRHYLRGGVANKFLDDEFVGWRLSASRAWAEWRLLANLYDRGLPVPRPVAAGVRRYVGFYRCDLITQKIANTKTLAELLQNEPLSALVWQEIGACLRRFHNVGVNHADLNANNILLDDQLRIYLIDFDRGKLCRPGAWQKGNLDRLERSLLKIAKLSTGFHYMPEDWRSLVDGYNQGSVNKNNE
jgi:3-deoxy-D-manno-octulosonic acid kinase